MPRIGRSGLPVMRHGGNRAAPVTALQYGNTPGYTGPGLPAQQPPPHPATQPMGGQAGAIETNAARPGASPMVPRATFAQQPVNSAFGEVNRSDALIRRDRHPYFNRGHMRVGVSESTPGNPPNPVTQGPAFRALATVNMTLNPQQGSDNSANQDDLSRPYTWVGQNDGSTIRVNGGVPGLYIEYGNRGYAGQGEGLPNGIHDPSNGQGGVAEIWSGPPHGLHSATVPSGKQVIERYTVTPQMTPPRLNRPDNSRIAGQSYSQTVLPQGATARPAAKRGGRRAGVSLRADSGRGARHAG